MVEVVDRGTSIELLATSVDAYVAGERRALSDAMDVFRDPRVVERLLRSVLADEAWLSETLARSYWHPNGFLKMVLAAGESFQLRMHVWQPVAGGQRWCENVHSHRWDFCSVIFMGGYRYQEFVPLAEGEPYHAYTYDGHSGVDTYGLAAAGVDNLCCTLDAELAAGTHYTLTADALHRVVADQRHLAASLVLQGPRRPEVPVRVFADHAIPVGGTLPLRSLSPGDLLGQLNDLLAEFGRAGRPE
jgi:hypothetical protein